MNPEKNYKIFRILEFLFSFQKRGYLGGLSSRREKLYETAYSFLGKDASPRDMASDEFGCAESVNAVFRAAFGKEIGGDVSTIRMYEALRKSSEFLEVDSPLFGDVIISPTGMVRVAVGHVGIVGKWQIMSSNSSNGRWEANYTLESWRLRWGFVKYFRIVELPEAPPGVKEIAEKGIGVAREAAKYPSLLAPAMALLKAIRAFLSGLRIKL